MAVIKSIEEALTFDDVLLRPGLSDVMPGDVDVKTRITRTISLNIPIISSAMDTVTEARMAIAMAQAGGIGVIHRNLDPEIQADHVRQVKRFESGMVLNPITIHPDETLADALALMKKHGFSGFPVVERGPNGKGGKLVGILTNRDVRFATRPDQPVSELMTKDRLITVGEGVTQEEAKRLLHQFASRSCWSSTSITAAPASSPSRTSRSRSPNPHACKDEQGRLRVAAATTVGEQGYERTEMLIDAGVDLVVVDTAHGHSQKVLDQVARIKRLSNKVQVVAGNVATGAATRALIDAGADAIKVGIGPGSICTTRIVAGVGVPQLTAIMESVEAAQATGTPVIADGGIKFSGDLAKALAAARKSRWSADFWPVRTRRPVRSICGRDAPTRATAAWARSVPWPAVRRDRYFQAEVKDALKLVPEGIEGQVPYKGPVSTVVHQLVGGLRAAMGYTAPAPLPISVPRPSSCGSREPACVRAMSTT